MASFCQEYLGLIYVVSPGILQEMYRLLNGPYVSIPLKPLPLAWILKSEMDTF